MGPGLGDTGTCGFGASLGGLPALARSCDALGGSGETGRAPSSFEPRGIRSGEMLLVRAGALGRGSGVSELESLRPIRSAVSTGGLA